MSSENIYMTMFLKYAITRDSECREELRYNGEENLLDQSADCKIRNHDTAEEATEGGWMGSFWKLPIYKQ